MTKDVTHTIWQYREDIHSFATFLIVRAEVKLVITLNV
jgi:hypothetical protein